MGTLALNRWLVVLCLVILAFTVAIFPVIPRLSTQRLFDQFSQAKPSGAVSDFGEDIEFGQYQQIGLSNAVALYAQPKAPDQRGDHVRLRGVTVDTFDGTRWRRSTQHAIMMGGITYRNIRVNPTAPPSEWTILLQPGKASHLFAPSYPETLKLEPNQSVLFDDASASAQLPGVPNKLFSYVVSSRLELPENRSDPGTTLNTMFFPSGTSGNRRPNPESDPRPTHLRPEASSGTSSSDDPVFGPTDRIADALGRPLQRRRQPVSDRSYIRTCLQVPDLLNTTQLLNLAREWTEGTNDNPYLMARAIESRLRETFEYSLVQSSQGNFIQDFLLRTRSGHCEYFATSMAVLLRLLGVPTRVVNGYYSTEWDPANQAFIVRQKDAHAWVEVYLGDAVGWMTFDPTPSSGVSRTVTENQFVRGWRELMDSLRLRWYRNVIDFSIQDQTAVRRAIFSQNGIMARVGQVFGQANSQRWDRGWTEAIPAGPIGVALVLGGAALLFFALRDQLAAFFLRIRLRVRGRATTVQFYGEILRHLARRGLHRRPDQTPREFAEEIMATYQGLEGLTEVTETYYAVRYAHHTPTPDEQEKTLNLLLTLRKWNRKKNRRMQTGFPSPAANVT